MNLFAVNWCWYEESWDFLFIHENKSEEEFKQDIEKHIKDVGQEYLDQEDSWVGANGWIEYAADTFHRLGYKKVEPIRWSHFGGYILKQNDEMMEKFPEDYKLTSEYKETISWQNIVGEELMVQALAKNKEIDNKLYVKHAERKENG